jgi:uncharacterized membrane protein
VDAPPRPPAPDAAPVPIDEMGALRALYGAIKSRIFSGLLLALPFAITIWIIYQLYSTLQGIILDPIAHLISTYVGGRVRDELPFWWDRVVAPLIAIAAVLVALYFLGYFVRTRMALMVDWVMVRLPGVTIIYKAVRNMLQTLESQRRGPQFKRVVLVEFPHPGMKALAFVTKTLHDADTGRTILCVCILTGVVPPTGFTLFVPEESVVEVDWTVNEVLQVILSGGLTSPGVLRYSTGGPTKLIVPGRVEPAEEVDAVPAVADVSPLAPGETGRG